MHCNLNSLYLIMKCYYYLLHIIYTYIKIMMFSYSFFHIVLYRNTNISPYTYRPCQKNFIEVILFDNAGKHTMECMFYVFTNIRKLKPFFGESWTLFDFSAIPVFFNYTSTRDLQRVYNNKKESREFLLPSNSSKGFIRQDNRTVL